MHDKQELCDRIINLFPEIGECEIDVDVNFDNEKKVWIVDMKKDEHELRHYLEISDADQCMESKQCVSLGLEIAQLKKNILGQQF